MTKYFTKDGDNYVEVEDELLTTEQVNSVVKERGERIARQKFSDYDDLKEKAGKLDTVTKDFETKLKAKDDEIGVLNGKVKTAELATDKVKIMSEFKLSDDLDEFVVGDTVDEMRERAEKLSKGIPGGSLKINKDKKPEGKPNDSKVLAGKLFGKKSDD